jgi:transcriptional regulator with XRE-family HTH domain
MPNRSPTGTQLLKADTGRRVRSLRLRAHLSMRELARRAGVAVSYVSNVEAGRVSTTLATLRKLLVALGSDIGPFFSDSHAAPPGCVVRRYQMEAAADAGRCFTFVLPARPDVRMIMLDEELFAGERPEFESLAGDIGGYVISGELLFEVQGEEPQVLQAGDAFYVPAGRPVRGRCASGKSVRLVTAQLKANGACPPAVTTRRKRRAGSARRRTR